MKKFEFDMNKISFTKTGEKIISYYEEYQKASDIVKEAILNAVLNLYPFRAKPLFIEFFTTSETKEEFIGHLSNVKNLVNKDCKRERLAAAKKFIDEDEHMKNVEFQIVDDDKKLEKIVIRKMIGIKSTNFRQYFDFDSNESDSVVFTKNRIFLENFMNYYVRKRIKDFMSKFEKETKKNSFLNAAYTTYVSDVQPGRWININIDFIINIDKLDSNILADIYNLIKGIEAQNFF